MVVNLFGGWLNFPEYFFFFNYRSGDALYNTMAYKNPAMDKLIDAARFESDPQNTGMRSRALSGSPSLTFRALPCSSRRSTSRCRRTLPVTVTGFIACLTTVHW